jgi:hypothetical protein
MVEGVSRLSLSGYKGRPYNLKSKRRLTSRFERIENVKNFDVEKWYNFNFLFAESFKWACVKENADEMISVYDYENVVVRMVLEAWKIKLF